tara:strand:+ start:480 stop:704 length:225 start_codon:yes stop_codon:yes gene_type:complete
MDHNFKDILHNVDMTEGQISTILYCLEGYMQGNDDEKLVKEMEDIFVILEGVIDRFYDKMEKAQAKQPVAEWTD